MAAQTGVREEAQDPPTYFESSRKDAGQLGGKDAECEQGLVQRGEIYRSKDVLWRVKCRGEWWNKSSVFSASGAKVGPGVEPSWMEIKDERQRK